MASVDFEKVLELVDVPENARRILERPERQTTLSLNLHVGPGEVLFADVFVVYYNTARGPAKGGVRISPGVTLEETVDLAERMVWKTALVKIPFGGGKSGIAIDGNKLPLYLRNDLMREYVHLIGSDLEHGVYIPAPDLGSRSSDMATIYGQTHLLTSVTGKPPRLGGLPGRLEATGRGVAHITREALRDFAGKKVEGATVAVQGFGNVGGQASRFLADWGARVVAVTDVHGGRYDAKGLDVTGLAAKTDAAGCLHQDAQGDAITNEELLGLEVDVLIPAAVENVLTGETAKKVRAKLVVEGANGPTTAEGDRVLRERDVVTAPDILANAGGVVASYIEWRSAKSGSITDRAEVFKSLEEVMGRAYGEMLELSRRKNVDLRLAAQTVAVEEVVGAMQDRGWI